MIYITKKQREVMKRFKKHAEALLEGSNELNQMGPQDKTSFERAVKKSAQLQVFRRNADEILEEVDDHIEELEGLHKSAESVCKGVSIDEVNFNIFSWPLLTWAEA